MVVPWPGSVSCGTDIQARLRTSNPLGGRVHHDISSVVNWPDKVSTRAKRVIHDHGHARFMRNGDNLFKIRNVVPWVTDTLKLHVVSRHLSANPLHTRQGNAVTHINSLCLVINRSLEVLGLVAIDELCRYAKARQKHLELVVRSAIQIRRRDDIVARMRQRTYSNELRGLA